MNFFTFSKVFSDRVYVVCAERFGTGSGFQPPAARLVLNRRQASEAVRVKSTEV